MIVSELFALSRYYHYSRQRRQMAPNERYASIHTKGKSRQTSAVPLSLENLVDPLLQKTSEDMPPNAESSLLNGRISTAIIPSAYLKAGFRATNFRDSLCYCDISINYIDASSELVKRAKKIITTKQSFPEIDDAIIDDALAQELAVTAENLETGTEEDLVQRLGTDLIPTKKKVPHQAGNANRWWWSNAVAVPLDPDVFTDPATIARA